MLAKSLLSLCIYSSPIPLSLLIGFSSFTPKPLNAQATLPPRSSPADLKGLTAQSPVQPIIQPPSQQPQPQITPQPLQPPPFLRDVLPQPTPQPTQETPGADKIGQVTRFAVEGDRTFSQAEINTATEKFLNRELSFAELLQAADAITQLYISKGYITTGAYLPADRKISADGVVPIKVVVGYVDPSDINVQFVVPVKKTGDGLLATAPTQFEPAKRHLLQTDYIRSRLALAAHKPLNKQKLLEALQLLRSSPLVQDLQAELSAGPKPGQSVLNVSVVEAQTLSASLLLDNGRSPSVGTFRRQVQLSQANLLGLGDSLLLTYSNTDGSNEGNFSYTLPINPRNGTMSFNFGIADSTVVETPFDILDINSKSRYFELTFRQPLIQTPTQEFALGLTMSRQESKATLIDGEIPFPVPGSDFEGRTSVNALRFFQEWTQRSGRAIFAVRSQFSVGLNVLNATINEQPPDGRFFAWRGQAQWARLLAPDTLLLLRSDIQLADRALVPLEQFGLGGARSVRGYRQDALLSDSGFFASAEVDIPILRLPQIGGLLQIAPFAEVGTTWNRSGFANPDPKTLASVGLGLRLQVSDRLNARFDWGIPLISTNKPKNTLQETGLYFSLVYRFL